MEGSFPPCSCLYPHPSSCPPFPFNGMKNEGGRKGGGLCSMVCWQPHADSSLRDENLTGSQIPSFPPQTQTPGFLSGPHSVSTNRRRANQVGRRRAAGSDRLSAVQPFITAAEPASLHRCSALFCPRCFKPFHLKRRRLSRRVSAREPRSPILLFPGI